MLILHIFIHRNINNFVSVYGSKVSFSLLSLQIGFHYAQVKIFSDLPLRKFLFYIQDKDSKHKQGSRELMVIVVHLLRF